MIIHNNDWLSEKATKTMGWYLHLSFKYKYFREAIHETKALAFALATVLPLFSVKFFVFWCHANI